MQKMFQILKIINLCLEIAALKYQIRINSQLLTWKLVLVLKIRFCCSVITVFLRLLILKDSLKTGIVFIAILTQWKSSKTSHANIISFHRAT